MQRIIWLIIFLPAFVFCGYQDPFNQNEDPAIAYHVNVMAGNLQLEFEDHVVNGAVPFPIVRTYSNLGIDIESLWDWEIGGGWNFFPHMHLFLNPSEQDFKVYLKEPSGKLLEFSGRYNKKDDTLVMIPKHTGASVVGAISGRINSNNHRLHLNYKKGKAILYLADGGKRVYRGEAKGVKDKLADLGLFNFERSARHYVLEEEISPSGQRTIYSFDAKKNRVSIQKQSPSGSKR